MGRTFKFPLFEGGQISANVRQQRAAYEENVANYREQVLVAFQDVDDSLSNLHYLAEQQEAEDRALTPTRGRSTSRMPATAPASFPTST